ncbi:MAG: hypothetical protein VB050_08200 [Geobacteraceae bacterium]|nr:hypothetical protein [Geobacteraceae bacterium]
MTEPSPPYLTFWQIANRWAAELERPLMEVIQVMRADSTYLYPHPFECPAPALIVYPTALFHGQGVITQVTIANAFRISGDGANFRTPEYLDAVAFLNSAETPPEPDNETQIHLSHFVIKKADFEQYCKGKGYPLPKFWYPSPPEREDLETVAENFDPVAFVCQQLKANIDKDVIAFRLHGHGLQYGQIADVLHPGRYNETQHEARRQCGRRMVQSGKQKCHA